MKTATALFFIFLVSPGVCQPWTLLREVELEAELTSISVDNKDQFYAGLASGSLIRYTSTGEEDQYFSLVNNSAITLVEAWNRLKVFTFFRDQQRIEVLDRFTTTPRSLDLAGLGVPYIWLCAPGVDNSFWTLSTSLKELRKYDDQNLNLLTTIPLKNDLDLLNPVFMRSFKTYLFVLDERRGLFVFDQYGSFQRLYEGEGISYCQVVDGQVVFLLKDEIYFLNPENLEVVKKLKTPETGVFNKVVISGGNYVFFGLQSIRVYSAL